MSIKESLVIGARGMLGTAVCRVLATSNLPFRATATTASPGITAFSIEEGEEKLSQLVSQLFPNSHIINCAAVLSSAILESDPDSVRLAYQVNQEFPKRLAELASKQDLRIIHISTDGVFSPRSGCCIESSLADAQDIYGLSKRLGEVVSKNVLNLRVSVVGPSPHKKLGIFHWLLNQAQDAEINGFTDQTWNGVTTLQLASLCAEIIKGNYFEQLTKEASIAHFCPNQTVSKYELLQIFAKHFRPDVTVNQATNPERAVTRYLSTELTGLNNVFGTGHSLESAVAELSQLL